MDFHEEIMVYHGDLLVMDTSWDHFSMLTLENGGSTWVNHQQWRSNLHVMGIPSGKLT